MFLTRPITMSAVYLEEKSDKKKINEHAIPSAVEFRQSGGLTKTSD